MSNRPKEAFELRQAGMMWREIAHRLGYSGVSGAWLAARRYSQKTETILPKLPHRNVARWIEMRNSGMFFKDIAKEFGVSKQAVHDAVRRVTE